MLNFHEPVSGRYRLQQCLCRGSMSDVYLAYDELLQHEVVIKLVSNDQPESKQRLQSEIHTLRTFSHDHILPILDHGEYEGYHYLAMPYVKQGTLRDRIARERLTQEEAGHILEQVTSAIQFAHNQGIVHRDIKPSNILLDGITNQHVYLADFNLAKAMDKGSDLTQTGIVIGTPAYMAPELIDKLESASSDIYALGVLLYHMLTGQVPFSGSSPLAVVWKHVHELPVSPSSLNPAITAPVEQVIMRALNKDPQQRFPSAEALAQAYMHALRSSHRSAVAHPAVQILEPTMTQRAFKKRDHLLLPAVMQQRSLIPWWQHPHHDVQKAFMSIALVALLIIPLSLGFLLSRAIAPLPLAYKAPVAGVLQQSSLAPTPQKNPAVHPPGGNTIPPDATLSFSLHEPNNPLYGNGNGHGTGNGTGTGQGKGNGNDNGNGQGKGTGNGNGQGKGTGNGTGQGKGNGDGNGNGNGNGQGNGNGNGQGNGTGKGQGNGNGNGNGDGNSNGHGTGNGTGNGHGNGNGNGNADGHGNGNGNGNGNGDGNSNGHGNGQGNGTGQGKGTGNGNGQGNGTGQGNGNGNGHGNGNGNGNGNGHGNGDGKTYL